MREWKGGGEGEEQEQEKRKQENQEVALAEFDQPVSSAADLASSSLPVVDPLQQSQILQESSSLSLLSAVVARVSELHMVVLAPSEEVPSLPTHHHQQQQSQQHLENEHTNEESHLQPPPPPPQNETSPSSCQVPTVRNIATAITTKIVEPTHAQQLPQAPYMEKTDPMQTSMEDRWDPSEGDM